jgi:hypothetical protein
MTMPDPELFPGAAPKKKAPRRRYLFEAICEAVYEKHWRNVKTKRHKGRANATESELLKLGLKDTPDGARIWKARVRRWRQVFAWKEPLTNPLTVIDDWEACGQVKQTTAQPGQPSRKEQATMKHEFKEWSERTLAWWNGLSKRERLERSRKYPRGIPVSQIAWGEYQRSRPGTED